MASFWWPLQQLSSTPGAAGSSSDGALALTHLESPRDPSGPTTGAAMRKDNTATAVDARRLAQAAFHTSLENLLVESTKHHTLVPLRDAIQSTRQLQYDSVSLFDTLCIACLLLAERCAGEVATATRRNQSSSHPCTNPTPDMGGLWSPLNGGTATSTTGNNSEVSHNAASVADAVGPPTTGAHALHYRYHPSSRVLLLQSIGDIGKLIALALLPVTPQVGQRVAHLVRELAFQCASVSPGQDLTSAPQPRTRSAQAQSLSKTNTPLLLFSAQHSHVSTPQDKELPPKPIDPPLGSSMLPPLTPTATSSVAPTAQPVRDDQVLLRLLQLVASTISSCRLGNSALADLCSVLLLLFRGAEPQSMLEATCEATLAHHIHTVLSALHDSGSRGDDTATTNASDEKSGQCKSPSGLLTTPTFTAQLQGVAFIKDICRLIMGARTRWLHISPHPSVTAASDGATGSGHRGGGGGGTYGSKRNAAAHHKGGMQSSMAGVTLSVAAAEADASRQWGQQQQRLSDVHSLASSFMNESLAPQLLPIDSRWSPQTATAGATGASEACGYDEEEEMPSLYSTQSEMLRCTDPTAVPERLRLFLVRTITQLVKEQAKAPTGPVVATVAAAASVHSPLYAQCLNDCFSSVALWGLHEMDITVSMQPLPTLFVEIWQQPSRPFRAPRCSLEMFMCTQQLALVSVNTHFRCTTYFTQVLLAAHEQLLRRLCRRRKPDAAQWISRNREMPRNEFISVDKAERWSQAATVVLSLWRKMLTSAPLFWQLMQLRSIQSANSDGIDTDAPAEAAPEDIRAYRSNGLYRASGSQMRPEESQDNPDSEQSTSYTCDGDRTKVFLQQWSKLSHSVSQNQQLPWMVRSCSRESFFTSSQRTRDGSYNCPQEYPSMPPLPGSTNAAAIYEEGDGSGVGDTAIPALVRLVMSVLALTVSHMQPQDVTESAHGKCRGGDWEEAEDTMHEGPLLLKRSPTTSVLSGDATDGVLSERPRQQSPLHADPVAPNASDAVTTVSTPLCLCLTNTSVVYKCFAEAHKCLTAFGQLLAQLVDAQLAPSVATADKEQVLRRCRTCFLVLHPHLLHCEQLSLRHLRYEEDLLPVIMKATGYWVQVSCVLGLTEERDAYLGALVDGLRAQDTVMDYLVSLAPLNTSGMSDTTSPTTTALLETLVALHNECAATDVVVPGSVAASLRNPSDACNTVLQGATVSATSIRRYALNVSSWGIGWLLRRDRTTTATSRLGNETTTTTPRAASKVTGVVTVIPSDSQVTTISSTKRGFTSVRSSINMSACLDRSPVTAAASHGDEPQPVSSAIPSPLISRGWQSPVVQQAVILSVCRLQHKVSIMKTLHTIATTLGPHLKTGWTLLARGLVMTEPLLHTRKRLLSWIDEAAEEQEYHTQLLSDSLHLRDALRCLCLHNTSHLPYDPFEIFFAQLVKETAELTAAAPSQTQDGAASAVNDRVHQLPRHDPQGAGDQWVLTSECLSLSLLAMLPFIGLRYTEAAIGTPTENTASGSEPTHRPGVQAIQLQHQRTGALARALRLWEQETKLCSYLTDHNRVTEWGTAMLTNMRLHKEALLAAVVSNAAEASTTGPNSGPPHSSLAQETGNMELVLSTIVSHISVVAVQLCRSASRRRVRAVVSTGTAGSGPLGDASSATSRTSPSAAVPSSFQAMQCADLVLTSGPFAMAPLTQTANAIFSAPGPSLASNTEKGSLGGVDGDSLTPLLPFVQQKSVQTTSALLAAVHWSAQGIAHYTALDESISSTATSPSIAAPLKLDPLERLLASPFALLDRIYLQWQGQYAGSRSGGGDGGVHDRRSETPDAEHAPPPQSLGTYAASTFVTDVVLQMLATAASAVLMDVVKMVQSYGEDIEGAAWEHILSLLQRTTITNTTASSAIATTMEATTEHGDVAVSNSVSLRVAPSTQGHHNAAGATTLSSQSVESLNMAFRALESIQHNHIPRLSTEGLYCLIECVGSFTVHRIDSGASGERKLHTNLSAVQLLWSIADYLATFGSGVTESLEICNNADDVTSCKASAANITAAGSADTYSGETSGSPQRYSESSSVTRQQQDRLWCSLLTQLRNGCLDDRQEVRQSALQTFFALVQTYGWRFSAACWRCVLEDVLVQIIEVVAVATDMCATPSPMASPSAPCESGGTVVTAAMGERCVQDTTTHRILRSFVDHPEQLEQVRISLFNAGSRLFVTHMAHMHAPTATAVLELFLRLCGDVCLVVRGTSGEHTAMAAVHALHGLLVEMPGCGLPAHAVDLAWGALERLILRGGNYGSAKESRACLMNGTPSAPFAHTETKQCTIPVVAATVAAICDSFRLQRLTAAEAEAEAGAATPCSPASTMSVSSAGNGEHSPRGIRSYLAHWSGGGSPEIRDPQIPTSGAYPRYGGTASSDQYFTRLLCLLEATTRCSTVVTSYYFPSKAQSTLLEGVTALWPTLSSREARMMWFEVLVPAFPSATQLQSFTLQELSASTSITEVLATGAAAAATTTTSAVIPLDSVMPPGSHPGYLSAVMDTMRTLMVHHLGKNAHYTKNAEVDELSPAPASANASAMRSDTPAPSEEDRVRVLFMAPSIVKVTGTLLLLHLASAETLSAAPRSGSLPFTLPALFLQDCFDLMQYTLWEAVLARSPPRSSPLSLPGPPHRCVSSSTAAAAQCRRDGVAALSRVFEMLLTSTSTLVRHLDAVAAHKKTTSTHGSATAPTTTVVPPHVTAALQLLDLLVDTLGEVVHIAMEQYEDVVCATAAITVLSIASTAEGMALARVARRSVLLLQHWACAVAGAPSPRLPSKSVTAMMHHHNHTRSSSDVPDTATSAATGITSLHPMNSPCAHASPTADIATAASPATTSHSQLQDVARASMKLRDKATVTQFLSNPDDPSAGALLVETLRDMLNMVQHGSQVGSGPGGGAARQHLRAMIPELLQLVAWSSLEPTRSAAAIRRERDIHEMLAKLLTIAVGEQQNQVLWHPVPRGQLDSRQVDHVYASNSDRENDDAPII